jgi:hypothetical protein
VVGVQAPGEEDAAIAILIPLSGGIDAMEEIADAIGGAHAQVGAAGADGGFDASVDLLLPWLVRPLVEEESS